MTPWAACKLIKFLRKKKPHKSSETALHGGCAHNKCLKQASNKSRNRMTLQNNSLDQSKSVQKCVKI